MIKKILLEHAIKKSWVRETAFPENQENWSPEKPTTGQCAVTAALVKVKLGGKIHKNEKFHHY